MNHQPHEQTESLTEELVSLLEDISHQPFLSFCQQESVSINEKKIKQWLNLKKHLPGYIAALQSVHHYLKSRLYAADIEPKAIQSVDLFFNHIATPLLQDRLARAKRDLVIYLISEFEKWNECHGEEHMALIMDQLTQRVGVATVLNHDAAAQAVLNDEQKAFIASTIALFKSSLRQETGPLQDKATLFLHRWEKQEEKIRQTQQKKWGLTQLLRGMWQGEKADKQAEDYVDFSEVYDFLEAAQKKRNESEFLLIVANTQAWVDGLMSQPVLHDHPACVTLKNRLDFLMQDLLTQALVKKLPRKTIEKKEKATLDRYFSGYSLHHMPQKAVKKSGAYVFTSAKAVAKHNASQRKAKEQLKSLQPTSIIEENIRVQRHRAALSNKETVWDLIKNSPAAWYDFICQSPAIALVTLLTVLDITQVVRLFRTATSAATMAENRFDSNEGNAFDKPAAHDHTEQEDGPCLPHVVNDTWHGTILRIFHAGYTPEELTEIFGFVKENLDKGERFAQSLNGTLTRPPREGYTRLDPPHAINAHCYENTSEYQRCNDRRGTGGHAIIDGYTEMGEAIHGIYHSCAKENWLTVAHELGHVLHAALGGQYALYHFYGRCIADGFAELFARGLCRPRNLNSDAFYNLTHILELNHGEDENIAGSVYNDCHILLSLIFKKLLNHFVAPGKDLARKLFVNIPRSKGGAQRRFRNTLNHIDPIVYAKKAREFVAECRVNPDLAWPPPIRTPSQPTTSTLKPTTTPVTDAPVPQINSPVSVKTLPMPVSSEQPSLPTTTVPQSTHSSISADTPGNTWKITAGVAGVVSTVLAGSGALFFAVRARASYQRRSAITTGKIEFTI